MYICDRIKECEHLDTCAHSEPHGQYRECYKVCIRIDGRQKCIEWDNGWDKWIEEF